MSSPEIYLQEGNELVAVAKIKATNYTKKKVVRDKLFKIDVELELGFDDYTDKEYNDRAVNYRWGYYSSR
jgi:hypothetical protein